MNRPETGMTDTLDIALLHRPGETTAIAIKHERDSVDFVVDGQSVFKATKADERDMSGCFWIAEVDARIKAHNQARAEQFTFARPAAIRETRGGVEHNRIMLFVCPECGDLGCGAITADIARDGDLIVWSRSGYQNDWQEMDGTNWDDLNPISRSGRSALPG
jgi:hypothetical protein